MKFKYFIFTIIFLHVPCFADLVVSSGEAQKDTNYPWDIAINVGPGWYRSRSGIIDHENETDTLVLFRTPFDPLCALVGEFTLKPHPNSFTNINIGAGFLPKGSSVFIRKNCTTHEIQKEHNCYIARFFNANMTAGLIYNVTKKLDIEAGVGYSYDYGYLNIGNAYEVNYYSVGPILSVGLNVDLKPYTINMTYSLMPNFYKEREYTRATKSMITLSFPLSFTNHFDIVLQHALTEHLAWGITCAFDFFKNYKKGTGTQTCPPDSTKRYTYLYDKLDTFIVVGFISVTF